jgi:hypothetical protein
LGGNQRATAHRTDSPWAVTNQCGAISVTPSRFLPRSFWRGFFFASAVTACDRASNSGTATWRSTGSTLWLPLYLSYLSRAYTELHKFDDAWRTVGEAMTAIETTKETWCEAELHRVAGEIALKSPVA